MAQPFIQTSFNGGVWAPNLWARTDLENYKSGAAELKNWYVDYRGGASTRGGSQFCLRAFDDSDAVRLIPFQASLGVGYALEFGDGYIRFFRGGAPVVEGARTITNLTRANPGVVQSAGHGYSNDDVILITGVVGMTEVNNRYFIVAGATANTFELKNMFGINEDTSGYTAYVSGGSARRVLVVDTPYAAADLALLKFAQNVNSLIITHPSYVPMQLTYTSALVWALDEIEFGSTIAKPTGVTSSTTLGADVYNYAYVVTAVSETGEESEQSARTLISNVGSLSIAPGGTNTIQWNKVTDASYYNIYRAVPGYNTTPPIETTYGYVGNSKGLSFLDTNITADFSQTPPGPYNPFATGYEVTSVTVTNRGNYAAGSSVTVAFSAPTGGGVTATGTVELMARVISISLAGTGYTVGDLLDLGNGVVLSVLTVGGAGEVATWAIDDRGSVTTTAPANPLSASGGTGSGAQFNSTWWISGVNITNGGSGYLDPSDIPTVTFTAASTSAATANLSILEVINPGVIGFFQQRSAWAGMTEDPNTVIFSRPGQYYNFNQSNPTLPDDSITAPIVSGQLANIKSLVPQPGGLVVLTDGPSYLMNGGALGAAIGPDSIVANAQSFVGTNDMPPIVANFDVLYAQAVGCGVRSSSYNFYANVFTGDDISAMSSHLFFGHELLEWAWCAEPYKIVWAVRDDGELLSLTYVKEQKFVAWAHHETDGEFESVCTIAEPAAVGYQNFLYAVVTRTVAAQEYKYIEWFPERPVSAEAKDYWTVDSALRYDGALASEFSGAEHLKGLMVTGLADGVEVTPFQMPNSGRFQLPGGASARKVTIGLAYDCELRTLPIDLQAPEGGTVQGKMKKINGAALRVVNSLGLSAGTSVATAKPIKDLIIGNVGSLTNQQVTDLVTGDVFGFMDPMWQEPGQISVIQNKPYPATILGYIPQVATGDTASAKR